MREKLFNQEGKFCFREDVSTVATSFPLGIQQQRGLRAFDAI